MLCPTILITLVLLVYPAKAQAIGVSPDFLGDDPTPIQYRHFTNIWNSGTWTNLNSICSDVGARSSGCMSLPLASVASAPDASASTLQLRYPAKSVGGVRG